MAEQKTYEVQLAGYTKMVCSDLVPKMGILETMHSRLQDDNQYIANTEPIFVPLFNAIKLDVFLSLAKLLDGKRSDRNLIKFVDYCEGNRGRIFWPSGSIPAEMINSHRAILTYNRPAIERIVARRDKFLAHNDKEYFLDEEKLELDFPLSKLDIINIIQCFQKIISDHQYGLFGSRPISTAESYAIATDNIFHFYSAGKCALRGK